MTKLEIDNPWGNVYAGNWPATDLTGLGGYEEALAVGEAGRPQAGAHGLALVRSSTCWCCQPSPQQTEALLRGGDGRQAHDNLERWHELIVEAPPMQVIQFRTRAVPAHREGRLDEAAKLRDAAQALAPHLPQPRTAGWHPPGRSHVAVDVRHCKIVCRCGTLPATNPDHGCTDVPPRRTSSAHPWSARALFAT